MIMRTTHPNELGAAGGSAKRETGYNKMVTS